MSEKIEELSRTILAYLKENPEAGDTLEGIAGWWLEQARIERIVDDVAAALDNLVKKGNLRACAGQSGSTIYKIEKGEKKKGD